VIGEGKGKTGRAGNAPRNLSLGIGREIIRIASMLPPIFSTSSDQWDGFIFEHHRQPEFALLPQSFLMHSVSIKLDGPSVIQFNCGDQRSQRSLTRGDLTIVPYGFTLDGASVEACEFLQLYIKPSVIDRAAKGVVSQAAIAPVLGVVDPLAEQTIYQLEEELTSGGGRADYVNLLIDTLATHLLRYYSESAYKTKKFGGFPEYLLVSTLTYIDRNLNRNLSVDEIALAVGVEPERFVRAFSAATGKSIDTYLKERRAEGHK
jgi:AraC-type DNA-binding domain-containing proteins